VVAGVGLRHKSAIRTDYAIHSNGFCSTAHYASSDFKVVLITGSKGLKRPQDDRSAA